jgi:hypothetical protein
MLEWNVQECADMQGLLDGEEGMISQTLAYFSCVAGVDWRITEKNAGEWFVRIAFYERLYGPLRHRVGKDGRTEYVNVTEEDIRRRVGMYLGGCMKQETRRAWRLRVSARFMDDREEQFHSARA